MLLLNKALMNATRVYKSYLIRSDMWLKSTQCKSTQCKSTQCKSTQCKSTQCKSIQGLLISPWLFYKKETCTCKYFCRYDNGSKPLKIIQKPVVLIKMVGDI